MGRGEDLRDHGRRLTNKDHTILVALLHFAPGSVVSWARAQWHLDPGPSESNLSPRRKSLMITP